MAFCKYCGTALEDDFRYCPSCGKPHNESGDINHIMDETFVKVADVRTQNYLNRLHKLEKVLEELEKELDAIIIK